MRILGIDPGLNVTGYGIVEVAEAGCCYLHHGVVRTKSADELPNRLLILRDGIVAIARQWEVDSAAVEASFVGNNARSALALGQARAAAIIALAGIGLPVAEYTPATVKQTVAGYGRSEKSQIARMVAMQLGLTTIPEPTDATDALAIAITHWAHSRLTARG
jgi:crossover junction endodeoxyribonuclease RuvC